MASLETPGAEPPPPPPPPPVYSWQPDSSQSPWLPDHPAGPPQPQLHSPTAPRQRRGAGGAAGGIVAALAAFFKYGLVALKFAKIGPTAISMVIAFGIYTLFFGPWFAVGVVLLILVHEMGHVLFSWIEGVPMSLPVFLGPFGAVTQLRGPLRDAKQEAIIALGGPLVGTVAAILVYLYATTLQPGHTQAFFFALAYFGCFINLFNLVPMSPLDGGRIANAISRWMNVVGLAIMLGFFLLFGNIFALILFIIGLFTTISRFRNAARGLEPRSVPPATRVVIGIVWLGMLVLAAGGLTVTHHAIVNGGVVQGVNQSSQNF
ncbi:MAG: site-2 protease family protein [Candidatus Dormibacteraeota bacterium]|nr:site-2 protease family protein [Candidatus Dormibacteraeota bacterium]